MAAGTNQKDPVISHFHSISVVNQIIHCEEVLIS